MSVRGDAWRCISWLSQQPQGARFEVKRLRERRTLTANAYYWAMLNQLARKLRMPDSEVHAHMLREYGACEVFEVSERVPLEDYFEHFDVVGESGGTRTVRVCKGSSRMDSAEFAALVNGMREEGEAQGIDVMTTAELASLDYEKGR